MEIDVITIPEFADLLGCTRQNVWHYIYAHFEDMKPYLLTANNKIFGIDHKFADLVASKYCPMGKAMEFAQKSLTLMQE